MVSTYTEIEGMTVHLYGKYTEIVGMTCSLNMYGKYLHRDSRDECSFSDVCTYRE